MSLIEPGSMYQDRMRQLDVRLSKTFRPGGVRARFTLDLANVLNGAAVITHNTTYGSSWLRPTYVLQGRIIKPGLQLEF